MYKTIGVDLGGTNVRCGVVYNGELTKLKSTSLVNKSYEKSVLNQIISLIKENFDEAIKGIGIGVPSVVDPEKGIVYDTVNIPSWKEVYLKDELEKVFNVPVVVNNDANCFALGEKYFGKAKDYKNIVGITLGTGVGAGLVINNKLYNGNNCGAGEIGMVPFKDSDYEQYCSGMYFKEIQKISAIELYKLAKEGDPKALNMFHEFGDNMSSLIKSVIYTYDPEIIVLGGSVSNAYPFFQQNMYDGLSDFGFPKSVEKVIIVVSELENAGVLGAAMLIKDSLK
ncbi:ROK family protein [Lutibacter citreus]|uniref:ROK family protein n=1 Tax=Lutibacter citreus TaxID=2138210 RepID=UPI000DBE1BBB|nr:ROK family protein [Lutibacter citreus]